VAVTRKVRTKEEYIYESRDNGVTVSRRLPLGEQKEYLITEETVDKVNAYKREKFDWLSQDELLELGREKFQQQELREKYPALQEAWEKYLVLLNLVKSGK
tara:strand:- start:188 stop:490 length:303 start_codon:yes stop_codon:yes gene_type:complete